MSENINTMEPYIIKINPIGSVDEGQLAVVTTGEEIPFKIKRSFWTYHTPTDVIRGRHAHYETEMILFALVGKITVNLESKEGEILNFEITNPTEGLYIPTMYWHTMTYTEGAVQLVLASTQYEEADYIRDYEKWKSL